MGYRIRPFTMSVRNNSTQQFIDVGLLGVDIENKFKEHYVTPQMYGAKADGTTDDTNAIQAAINSNPRRVIYFPDGEYLISSPITTSSDTAYCVDLVLSRFAKIIADPSWEDETECMIKLCDSGNSVNVYEPYHSRGITGGVIDCNSVASGISLEYGREQFIRNINIKNVKKYGIHIKRNSVHASNDADISDIYLQGYEGQENTGIFLEGSDNTITNLRTNGFRYGVDVASNGNIFKNIHPFYTTFEGGYNYESIAFIVRGYENRFETCYSDQYQVGFDFINANGTCTDCMVTWWSNNQAIQTAVRSSVPLAAVFNGLWVSFTTGSQNTILDCPTTSYGAGALYNLRVTGTKTVTGADYYYTKNTKANEYKIVTITGINSDYYVINNFKSTYNINSNYTIAGFIIRESSGVGNGLITIEYHESNDTLAIKIERQILRTSKTVSSINSNAYIYSNFSSFVGCNSPYDIVAINVEGSSGYSALPVAVEYDLTSDKAVFKSTTTPSNGTVKLNISYKNTITNGGVGLYLLLQH